MTPVHPAPSAPPCDAMIVAALLAVAGARLGGAVVIGTFGDTHQAWLDAFGGLRLDFRSPYRVPAGISASNLSGGIDLASSLSTGTRILQPGIGERSQGHPLLLAGAERWSDCACAQLLEAIGSEHGAGVRNVILALDSSTKDEPGVPAVLTDRLAFRIELEGISGRFLTLSPEWPEQCRLARERFDSVDVPEALLAAIIATAVTLGIASSRADRLAVSTARAHAAWRGARTVDEEDVELAVRLVLAPRARRMPSDPDEEPAPAEEPQERDDERESPENNSEPATDTAADTPGPLEDRMIEAAKAAIPPGLLDLLRSGAGGPGTSRGTGRKSSSRQRKSRSGRPVGHTAGDPRRDGPLHLMATIEKAAPWQVLRRRQVAASAASTHAHAARRLLVLPSDIRVMRFKRHAPSVTIFAVDASGSAAMSRLGEAKGAVELLLAECYARREQVALVAFRGTGADVLLPPTRALARARRTLGQLAGGGATPLANGIDAAYELAVTARRAGQTSLVVLLTDGRANIDSRGIADRKRATEHAHAAARRLAGDGIAALLVDVASAPGAKAAELARIMQARYLPLPNAGAREIAGAVALGRRSAE